MRGDKLLDAAKEFYKVWDRERKSLTITAIGTDKFANGKIDVILAKFNSPSFEKAYQRMIQIGTQEDPTPTRIPHMSYWLDGDEDKVVWLKDLIQLLEQ